MNTTMDGAKVDMAVKDETIRIRIPIKLRKRAGRREVVALQAEPKPEESLVRAIARAHAWQALLDSGELSSIGSLATRFHVDHSYVARTLRLASLAPDIVNMIVTGGEPDDLSLRRLMKGFSIRWDEQVVRLCADSKC